MSYVIEMLDCKNHGAKYQVRTYAQASKLAVRLLEHGTKFVGDKADRIVIQRVADNRDVHIPAPKFHFSSGTPK